MSKEVSIAFNGQMVRANCDGSKTNSRRPIRPQPPSYINDLHGGELSKRAPYQLECNETGVSLGFGFQDDNDVLYKCPYGNVGDTFRMDEAVRVSVHGKSKYQVQWDADCSLDVRRGSPALMERIRRYKRPHLRGVKLPVEYARPWRGLITEVRVERLRDISSSDAWTEGCRCRCMSPVPICAGNREAFAELWNATYGAGAWEANCWVWVIKYEEVK